MINNKLYWYRINTDNLFRKYLPRLGIENKPYGLTTLAPAPVFTRREGGFFAIRNHTPRSKPNECTGLTRLTRYTVSFNVFFFFYFFSGVFARKLSGEREPQTKRDFADSVFSEQQQQSLSRNTRPPKPTHERCTTKRYGTAQRYITAKIKITTTKIIITTTDLIT